MLRWQGWLLRSLTDQSKHSVDRMQLRVLCQLNSRILLCVRLQPLYSKACKGRKDNPNCLCGLIPAPESHRKTGLWARESEAIASIGNDPSTSQREVRLAGC